MDTDLHLSFIQGHVLPLPPPKASASFGGQRPRDHIKECYPVSIQALPAPERSPLKQAVTFFNPLKYL